MRVVVTGASGFIGSHVTERLLADGHEVVGIDCFTDYHDPSEKRRNISDASARPRFTLSEADLRTDALEPILEGADAVVNEAATPGLVLSWDDFERYLSCNVSAAEALDVEPVIEFREARRGDQRRTVADSSNARRALGWEPGVLPREGLALQAAWCREPAAVTR